MFQHQGRDQPVSEVNMFKSKTKEQFIQEAIVKHGNKYDYSLVEYIHSKTNVKIKCFVHGFFDQRPCNHLRGDGCPKCAIEARALVRSSSTEEFIQRAIAVHGNKFDYSAVEYINNRTKITINCPNHGCFKQAPNHHFRGLGCPKCGRESSSLVRSLSKEKFIEKAIAVHGGKYLYLSECINSYTKVNIECRLHGIFKQTPKDHLQGSGCPMCGRESKILARTLSKEEFIEKAIARHGDNKYRYPDEYIHNRTKVKIECLIHGIFEQLANNHLRGHGCPKCGEESRALAKTLSNEEFVERAIAKHGNKFDYSQLEYINDKTKVKIGCPNHGFFEQKANGHSQGRGCPQCANSGFDSAKSAILYLLKFKKDFAIFWKIGITNRTVEKRFGGESMFIVERNIWEYENGGDAYSIEQKVLAAFAKYRIEMPLFTLLGNGGDTECFVPSLPVQKVVNFIKKAYN